jgi:iron complex outermembrane receptor protein
MKKHVSILFTFLFICKLSSFSQNTSVKLSEVIVKDSSTVKPNHIDTKNKLDYTKSTPELLKSVPGLTTVKRSVFSEEAVINSFKYDQVSTIKNDACQASSSCPNRMDPITTRISPDEIQSIEIVKGPYNVRYGQIMGGLVRIITKDNLFNEQFKISGSAGAEYQTNGNGIISGFKLNGAAKKYKFTSFANYRKFDNYKSGDGTEIASSFETYSYGLGAGTKLSKDQILSANWTFSRANDVLHAGLPMDAQYDLSHMASIDYEIKNLGREIEHIKINLFGATEEHLMSNANRPNAHISLANTPVKSQNYGGRIEIKSHTSKYLTSFIGFDFAREHKTGHKDVTIYKNVCTTPVTVLPKPINKSFSVWQNSYLQNMGLFVQVKRYFTENLKVDAGLRGTLIHSDILDPEADFSALYKEDLKPDYEYNLNYFFSFDYKLANALDFKLAFGQGSRHASLLEKYINHFSVGQDMYEYVGNPHLKSEINKQVDFTVSKEHKHFYVYANIFYSRVRDYISAKIDSTIPRKFMPCKAPLYTKRFINLTEVEQYGYQLGININNIKHFYSKISLAYTHAYNVDLDEPLAETPPLNFSVILGYKRNKVNLELSNEYHATQDQIALSVGETTTPSFNIIGFKASYLLFKKFSLGFNIDNILNQNYYQHLSRPYKNMDVQSQQFYEPGRNFRLFARYLF